MNKDEQSIEDLLEELELERNHSTQWRRLLIAIVVANLFIFIMCLFSPLQETEEPPPAEGSEIVRNPHATTTAEGYVVAGHLFPWAEASGYSAEQFDHDCNSVCTAPGPSRYGDGDGRVLMTDAEHLVCVCFRPERMSPVERWVNWARVP